MNNKFEWRHVKDSKPKKGVKVLIRTFEYAELYVAVYIPQKDLWEETTNGLSKEAEWWSYMPDIPSCPVNRLDEFWNGDNDDLDPIWGY